MLLLFKHSPTNLGVFPIASLHGLISTLPCPAQINIVNHGELTSLSLPLVQVIFFTLIYNFWKKILY